MKIVCFHSIDDSVGRTKNRLIDDEAEESGSDINSDDDMEKGIGGGGCTYQIPEGIDIVERPSI